VQAQSFDYFEKVKIILSFQLRTSVPLHVQAVIFHAFFEAIGSQGSKNNARK